MRKHISTPFRTTTLTYSSPAVATLSPIPIRFYNAFPELNDVARDGSRSAFPQRAKYNLPLDSIFLPCAKWIDGNTIDEAYLMRLDPIVRGVYTAIFDRHGRDHLVPLPVSPELNQIYRFQTQFELAHKRLAATDYKWAFRTYFLASFYTTLENHLVRGQKIDVPLVDSHRGSRLQRHWKDVVDAFKPTQCLDEAVSLLICLVTVISPEEWKVYEQAWVAHEEAEIPGFADFYRKLRREAFLLKAIATKTDCTVVAEQIMDWAKREYSHRTKGDVSLVDEVCSNLVEKNQRVSWPRLFGKEVHHGLPQLRVQKDMVLGHAAGRISIPEAMQWFMALGTVLDDDERSFIRKDDAWEEYMSFFLERGEGMACPRISMASDSPHLRALAKLFIKKADGTEIDSDSNRTPAETPLVESISRYTIFFESIRQQVCTGVGLRCPFWTGSGCCEFRPLLQRTYDVANSFYPPWKHHWQRPPCLE